MTEASTERVARMLALVPFISRRPGVTLREIAAEFRADTEQIRADLQLLMLCGEPGYYPHELIDIAFDDDDGAVTIVHDAGLEDPVRLRPDEAVSLTVALRAVRDMPGMADVEAVGATLAKLEHVVGSMLPAVEVAAPAVTPVADTIAAAVREDRRVHLRYYTASRDDVTDRDVDPVRLLVVDGHTYLEGYCYRVEALRRFRLDRVQEVRVLPQRTQPTLWLDDSVPATVFTPQRGAPSVTLALAPEAAWVAEYYQTEAAAPDPDRPGWRRVTLRGPDDEWFVRLVLSLGSAARFVDRADLAGTVADRARTALENYDDPGRS